MDRFAPATRENPQGALFREFTVTLQERAEGDADERLAIAISSEQAVERWDWMTGERYLEVLDHSTKGPDLTYARDGLPFCLDHSLRSQVGLLEDVAVDGDKVIRGRLKQGNHPDAGWVMADMRGGIRKKVSIGYWPGQTYTQEKAAKGQIPTRRYTGWTLYEASSVSVPADYDVGVGRSGARGAAASNNDPATEAASTAHTHEVRTMSAENTSGAAPAPAAPAGPTREVQLAALAQEHNRATDLIGWIASGTTVEQARELVLSEYRTAAATRTAVQTGGVAITEVRERAEDKPWEPEEFFRSVVTAARQPENVDVRLRAQRGQNTITGADGGFVVPNGIVVNMLDVAKNTGDLWSRVTTRGITVGNDYTEIGIKEDSRVDGSRNGGVRHYWLSQGAALTESDAELKQMKWTVNKVGVYVKLTEEQIEDGPAMLSYINEVAPEEMRFGVERCIWEGLGSGQPLGIMNSAALVSVAIEGSQTIANTNNYLWTNAAKMLARIPARRRRNAAFFINDELWANILTATAGAGTSAAPMFTPPGMLASAPDGAIYGRPIVPIEYASAQGTVGDFVLADMSDYLLADKGGIKSSSSMHVEFVNDKQVLKFTYRVDGAPRTRSAQTPLKGTATKTPYVALAARS